MKIIASFVEIPELIAAYTAAAVGTSEFVDPTAILSLSDNQVGALFPFDFKICPAVPPVVGAKNVCVTSAVLLNATATAPFNATLNDLSVAPMNLTAVKCPSWLP